MGWWRSRRLTISTCCWYKYNSIPLIFLAALEYGYNTKEPSRTTQNQGQHSTTRNPPRPPSKELPTRAPFLIFIGSLSFETRAEDIDFLFKDQDVK